MTVSPLQSGLRTGLTTAENDLIRQQSIFSAADAILRLFLGLYLFGIGGVETVAVFFAARYLSMTIGFVIFGKLLRWFSSVTQARSSMLILSAFCIVLIYLGPDALHYVGALGLLAGFAEGIYWPSINSSVQAATHESTRNHFFARRAAFTQIAGALAPPLAGLALLVAAVVSSKADGYYILFAGLVVLLLMCRRQLKDTERWGGEKQKLYSVRSSFRRPRHGEWSLLLVQSFCTGARSTAVGVFAPILWFKVIESELGVSILSMVMTAVTALASIVAGRALARWPRSFWFGVVVGPVGLVLFALVHSWIGLAAYVLMVSAGDTPTTNAASKSFARGVERAPGGWKPNFHLFVEQEVAINAGRILGFALILFLLAVASELNAVRIGVIALAPLDLISGLCQVALARYEAPPASIEELHTSNAEAWVDEDLRYA